ncbi:MAG: mannitol dehydrogenase family protein [Rhodobacteraceae bacterium]|nr:mannitol dehydrogenase family protein [Paracoccaceae bacterium]
MQQVVKHLKSTSYDRRKTRIGVVHVGVGAFHRAHQAVYFDDLMDRSGDHRWAIAGVNLRPAQSDDMLRLRNLDHGYAVKSYAPDGNHEYRLVRSHREFVDWVFNPNDAEGLLARDSVELVTMTVTEGGYCVGDDGKLNLDDAEIRNELVGRSRTSVYAYLRAGLAMRLAAGGRPLTVLCCDNLRSNGRFLSENLTRYLRAMGDVELLSWVADSVSFPCSMVDRITPRPDPGHSAEVAERFGIAGDFTIHCEQFLQWVIDDRFAGERPRLDVAGAKFVDDVHPYEEAKIRILNGSHVATCFAGVLRGHRTFDVVLADPELRRQFEALTRNEILPSLETPSPVDHRDYLAGVTSRFLNRAIADPLSRIGMDGASKFPIFLLPTIRGCFDRGIVPEQAIAAIASWYVVLRRCLSGQMDFDYIDSKMDAIRPTLAAGGEHDFARSQYLWGDTAVRYDKFVPMLCSMIAQLESEFQAA